MRRGDKEWPQPFDLLAAIGLLTRLPVRLDATRAESRGSAAAWAWPLAGSLVGAIGALAAAGFAAIGLAPASVAALAIAAQIMVTGALHEDGLADTFDGLWGGFDRARRLEIMKDSSIGTYGVLGLLVVTLLRWQALSSLISGGNVLLPLVAAGTLSRAPMAVLMALLPNARGGGLSHKVGRPSAITAGIGVALAIAVSAACVGVATLPTVLGVAAASLCLAGIAMRKIGGQTGDILGASQQVSEAIFLTVLVATLG